MASKSLTIPQAAQLVGCPETTLTLAIKAGRLSATRRPDGSYVVDAGEIERRRADWDVPARDQRRDSDSAPKDKRQIKV